MNMREEFEKWFKEKFEVPDFVFSDFDESAGEYSYTDETEELYINITMMFEAWKGAQPKWIKCSERLPDVEGKYLTDGTYGVGTLFFTPSWSNVFQDCASNNDEGMEDFEGRVFRVTHWMPLPNPPEE